MTLEIYCYRDKKLGAFTTPFINNIPVDRSAVTIKRAIEDLDSAKRRKMRDLDLYHIGSYDDKTGMISAIKPDFILALDSIIIEQEESVNE